MWAAIPDFAVPWGLGIIVVAMITTLLSGGDASRRWLLLALVGVWRLRHSGYLLYRRLAGQGEDRRYAGIISLPLLLSAVIGPTPGSWLAVALTGALLWATGVVFESGRPGFGEYKARTSFFVPRPPRCTPRSAQNDDRRR